MQKNNPYMKKKNAGGGTLHIWRIPMHDFDNAQQMERDLLEGEFTMARIPNTDKVGFTHHVAIAYKDKVGDVYTCAMMQHHGELKDTKENENAFQKQSSDEISVQPEARSGEGVPRETSDKGPETARKSGPQVNGRVYPTNDEGCIPFEGE